MPLVIHQEIGQDHLAVWEMSETTEYFLQRLPLYPHEASEINAMNQKRQLEYLASRYCLHLISNRQERGAIIKDACGKPALEGSALHISMSHSENYAAIFASPQQCGIDIQRKTEKVERVHQKFIGEPEKRWLTQLERSVAMHLIWGTKECMYKAYGKREIDFRKHLLVEDINWKESYGSITARLQKGNLTMRFSVEALVVNDYYLIYAKESTRILDFP